MLFRLLLLRLMPVAGLKILKERSKLRWMVILLGLFYVACAVCLLWGLWKEKGWYGIGLMLPALFPQYLLYGFAFWMLLRCISYAWSERVWNRIHAVSVCVVLLGILAEKYWNPLVLEFFTKIFSKIWKVT